MYKGPNSPCEAKDGMFETPSNEFTDIPTAVLLDHAKKLRLAKEAKEKAARELAEAKAALKKKEAEELLKAKRAKAAKMRAILAKAKAAAEAANKKTKLKQIKTLSDARSAAWSALLDKGTKIYGDRYAKIWAKSKNKDVARIAGAHMAIARCKLMKKSLKKQLAKKVGEIPADRIIKEEYAHINKHFRKIISKARKARKEAKKATSVKAAVKNAIEKKASTAKKLILVQEGSESQVRVNKQELMA